MRVIFVTTTKKTLARNTHPFREKKIFFMLLSRNRTITISSEINLFPIQFLPASSEASEIDLS